jgi:hypothetical protein
VARNSILLVFSNPADGQEDAYNEWYDGTHVPDVLAVPGVIAAQRYEVAPMKVPEAEGMPEPEPPAHRYLATYELDRDADEVMAEFLRRLGSGEMTLSETMDFGSIAMAAWQPRGPRRSAD